MHYRIVFEQRASEVGPRCITDESTATAGSWRGLPHFLHHFANTTPVFIVGVSGCRIGIPVIFPVNLCCGVSLWTPLAVFKTKCVSFALFGRHAISPAPKTHHRPNPFRVRVDDAERPVRKHS